MKRTLLLLAMCVMASPVLAVGGDEKPVQHMQVAEITSLEEAERIFVEKTAELEGQKSLDDEALQQIHVATYSIEKSVAYFVFHLEGQQQELARELAVVVEDLHIASENLRQDEAKVDLDKYLSLSQKLIAGF